MGGAAGHALPAHHVSTYRGQTPALRLPPASACVAATVHLLTQPPRTCAAAAGTSWRGSTRMRASSSIWRSHTICPCSSTPSSARCRAGGHWGQGHARLDVPARVVAVAALGSPSPLAPARLAHPAPPRLASARRPQLCLHIMPNVMAAQGVSAVLAGVFDVFKYAAAPAALCLCCRLYCAGGAVVRGVPCLPYAWCWLSHRQQAHRLPCPAPCPSRPTTRSGFFIAKNLMGWWWRWFWCVGAARRPLGTEGGNAMAAASWRHCQPCSCCPAPCRYINPAAWMAYATAANQMAGQDTRECGGGSSGAEWGLPRARRRSPSLVIPSDADPATPPTHAPMQPS